MTIEQIKESFQRERKYRLWMPTIGIMSYPIPINEFAFTEVKDGVTFLEFTGLKDKDGKEIYEGDIVRVNDENRYGKIKTLVYCVAFINSSCVCILFDSKYPEVYPKSLKNQPNIEIIGNVFENPELLM